MAKLKVCFSVSQGFQWAFPGLGLVWHLRRGLKLLRVVKNVTWRQHIANEVLHAGLPKIWTTVRERRLSFSGHCWRSRNEVVSNLVLWEPKHGNRSVRGQAGTFVDLLEAVTRVPRDCLPAAMDNRVGCRKRVIVGRGGG